MNSWRNSQLFPRRNSVGFWFVISLLFAGLSFGAGKIREQREVAKTEAIQKLSTRVTIGNVELDQLERDTSALKKPGNVTAAEMRVIQARLDEIRRKAGIARSEFEASKRN